MLVRVTFSPGGNGHNVMMLRTIAAWPVQPLLLGFRRRPIASCFGGGGSFGIGFGMGVVAGLRDAGIPVDQGPMLCTSAGACATTKKPPGGRIVLGGNVKSAAPSRR